MMRDKTIDNLRYGTVEGKSEMPASIARVNENVFYEICLLKLTGHASLASSGTDLRPSVQAEAIFISGGGSGDK